MTSIRNDDQENRLEDNRPVYTLRIASELSSIPSHSIRQYIDKGLLLPYKLKSNRHLFSSIDIHRLRNIHSLIHEKGLNFAGIRALMAAVPCWAIRKCSLDERKSCRGFSENAVPCWEVSEKDRKCKNENCRTCEVYLTLSRGMDLKAVFKEMF
jgi:MerR family transcriptional regulator/heat shock protein HspR